MGMKLAMGMGMLLVTVALAGPGEWLQEVEVKSDPDREGLRDYTFRFRPDKTHAVEAITFECVYHQEFPWENVWGKKYTKVIEPVSFTYRQPGVRLTADLDKYISFRMPVSRARLEQKYGPKTFNKDAPIVVDRIIVKAVRGEETVWSFTVPPKGMHLGKDLANKSDVSDLPDEK